MHSGTRIGFHAALALVAALLQRRRTGKAQYIDLAARDVSAAMIGDALVLAALGLPATRPGNGSESMAPHGGYATRVADRWMTLAIRNDAEWLRLLQELDQQSIAEDTRFATTAGRIEPREALERARAAGLGIGFVRVGFSPDYRECPPASPIFSGARKSGLFKLGAWGTQTHPDFGQSAADFDIVKHRVSPFYATSLEAILRANDIRRIYCSGISTNAVVQATVREGHDRDYKMIVLEDCCCALSVEEHEIAINSLRRFCTMTTSTDVEFN